MASEPSLVQRLHRSASMIATSTLRSPLAGRQIVAIQLGCRVAELVPFGDATRDRLLQRDVLARRERGQRCGRVPVIGRGNHHRINILSGRKVSEDGGKTSRDGIADIISVARSFCNGMKSNQIHRVGGNAQRQQRLARVQGYVADSCKVVGGIYRQSLCLRGPIPADSAS